VANPKEVKDQILLIFHKNADLQRMYKGRTLELRAPLAGWPTLL
jgi:hypothetical protein